MQGTLRIEKDLYDHMKPETLHLIKAFLCKAKDYKRTLDDTCNTYIFTLDHPDFDVADARYDLVFTTTYSGYNRVHRLKVLTRYDEEKKKFITVKDYV